jgi:hypothetical protein
MCLDRTLHPATTAYDLSLPDGVNECGQAVGKRDQPFLHMVRASCGTIHAWSTGSPATRCPASPARGRTSGKRRLPGRWPTGRPRARVRSRLPRRSDAASLRHEPAVAVAKAFQAMSRIAREGFLTLLHLTPHYRRGLLMAFQPSDGA